MAVKCVGIGEVREGALCVTHSLPVEAGEALVVLRFPDSHVEAYTVSEWERRRWKLGTAVDSAEEGNDG